MLTTYAASSSGAAAAHPNHLQHVTENLMSFSPIQYDLSAVRGMTEIGSGGETTSERDGSSDAVVSPTSFSSSASEQIPYSLYLLSKIGSGNRLAASEEEETEEEEVRLLSQPEPFTSVSDIELLRVYLREPGIWVEALDSARHFTIVDMQHMMNCLPFKSAALALASTIKDMTDASCPAYKSLELYQKAITDLIRCRPMDDDGGVLAAAVLLFVYEMMAAKDVNWRRHLQGCAGMFLSHNWNGSTPGLVGSCFWGLRSFW